MNPICIDLDGTLIKEDVTFEACKIFIKRNYFNIFIIFGWLIQGRAHLKHMLGKCVEIDVSSLTYNKTLLEYIIKKKREGHKIFLATACNQIYANKVASHLKLFDGIFASSDQINLRSKAKAKALSTIFGEKGFIYAGNSVDDLKVWKKSSECILVTPTKSALRGMRGRDYLLFK
ncbi:MAG: hypothetical protein LBF57_01770 [Holosporaceae bacterium]|jgi:phosphoserine phosphatase|nr:hypothetical protein [Holosporaceae bacterium]